MEIAAEDDRVDVPEDPVSGKEAEEPGDAADQAAEDAPAIAEAPLAEPPETVALAAVDVLRAELAAHNVRAAAREQLVGKLHEEVQRLRTGERAALLRPVIVDLGRLRNSLLRQSGESTEDTAAIFAGFADDVTFALERVGAEPLSPTVGGAVTPGSHRVVGVVDTGDVAADGTVAAVDADGYVDTVEDKVVLPALVRAHRAVVVDASAETHSESTVEDGQ